MFMKTIISYEEKTDKWISKYTELYNWDFDINEFFNDKNKYITWLWQIW